MAKTASEHLNKKAHPKKVVLENDFGGIKAGQLMLVGTPQMIDRYIRRIPRGETRSIRRLRNELARRNKCDAACPVSTSIFVRIASQAAIDEMQEGASVDDVTPFWRVVSPDDKIAARLTVEPEWIERQRGLEQ